MYIKSHEFTFFDSMHMYSLLKVGLLYFSLCLLLSYVHKPTPWPNFEWNSKASTLIIKPFSHFNEYSVERVLPFVDLKLGSLGIP